MKNAGKQGALRAWKRSQVREEQYPKVACQRNAEGGEHIRERAHCGSHIRKVRVCAHVLAFETFQPLFVKIVFAADKIEHMLICDPYRTADKNNKSKQHILESYAYIEDRRQNVDNGVH